MTLVVTTWPSTSTTSTRTLPSSISRKSPGLTSAGRPLKVVETISLVPCDVVGGDLEDVADGEIVGSVGELAEADLRALQVDEHGDGPTGVIRRLAHVGEVRLVHRVVAVAEVHAGDVDAGVDDGANHLVRRRGRPKGGDDLGASHPCVLRVDWGELKGKPRGGKPSPAYAGWSPMATSRRAHRRGQRRLAHQERVDVRGGGAALRDRPDDERLTAPGVAGDEDAGDRRLVPVVALDVAARR